MTEEKAKFFRSAYIPLAFVLFIILIKLVEFIFEIDFINFGLYPRTIHGLLGIIISPFLHSNLEHLFSNIFPIIVLGISIGYFYPESSRKVYLIAFFLTGFLVWIFARESYHIGASGVAYALFSFLFFSGILRRDKRSITLSLLVVFIYGGLIYGVFPTKEGISWESHLIGGLVGLLAAAVFRKKDIYKKYDWEEEILKDDIRSLEVSYKKGYQADSDRGKDEDSSR